MSKQDLKDRRFDNQHEDEELLMLFRQHPIVMRKGLIIMLVGLLVGTIPAYFTLELTHLWFMPLGMALGGIWLFWEWIGWYYSVYYVSDQRIIQVKQKGLFKRSVVDIGLDKIQNINFDIPGMQATMFKYGTIVVQTFAGDLVMTTIYHPQQIQESLIKIIKELGYGSTFAETAMRASHSGEENEENEDEEE